MKAIANLVLAVVVVVQGCAVAEFRRDETVGMPDNELAIIYNRGFSCPFCIERIVDLNDDEDITGLMYDIDRHLSYDPIKLRPGRYLIEGGRKPPKIPRASFSGEVTLRAGHTYRVVNDTCYTPCAIFTGRGDYTSTIWLEDTTTGEVIAGHKW